MEKIIKIFIMGVLVLIFVMSVSFFSVAQQIKQPLISPQAPAPAIQKPLVKPKVILPDYPQIREFTLNPHVWLMSETGNVLFRWRVEPGPAGTPVSGITITRRSGDGPRMEYSSSDVTGQYNLNISSSPFIPEGRTVYTLTATNEKGATNTRTVEFDVKSMSSVREEISMVSLQTEPAEISESMPFTFILRLNNRSGLRVPSVNIPVSGKDISLWEALPSDSRRPPPNQGELRDQIIAPGINEYRIRCNPGIPSGLADRYLFDIVPEYRGWRILGIYVRLEFASRSGTVDLYRIRVFERR